HGFQDKLYMRFAGSHLTDKGATSMGFLRPARLPAFDEQELEVASLALPAFEGAARRIAASRDRAHAAMEALAGAHAPQPTFALDASGHVLWVSAAAELLLGPLLARRAPLPDHLLAAARRLARFALSGDPSEVLPVPFTVELTRADGVVLEAELWIAHTPSGE